MDEKTIIVQMVESEENESVVKEAIAVLKNYFGESRIILPAYIKKPT